MSDEWNEEVESYLISIGEKSASFQWMHNKTSSYYTYYYKLLAVFALLLSTGLTSQNLLPDDNKNNIVITLRKIFTTILTFINVIQMFLNYEKLSEKHNSSSYGFGTLHHMIQEELCKKRIIRKKADIFLGDCLKSYDNLILTSPQIPNFIINKFKNSFKESKIIFPEIADNLDKIIVNTKSFSIDTEKDTIDDIIQSNSNISLENNKEKNDKDTITNLKTINKMFI